MSSYSSASGRRLLDRAREDEIITRGVQYHSVGSQRLVRFSSGDVLYVISGSPSTVVDVVLPDASRSAGQSHIIKSNGSAAALRVTTVAGLVDNTATISAAGGLASMTFMSDGANWWRIAGSP